MKEKEKNAKIQKILGYWHTMDFLAQDKFDEHSADQSKVKKHLRNMANSRYKTLNNFLLITPTPSELELSVFDIVSNEVKKCGFSYWGDISLYVGRIQREKCIKYISEILADTGSQKEENRPENNTDKIAVYSLQLSSEGKYVDGSLSLSTILWAITRLKRQNNSTEALDEEEYRKEVRDLEESYFTRTEKEETERKQESEGSKEDEEQESAAVTLKDLMFLLRDIQESYIPGDFDSAGKSVVDKVLGIQFQMFKDEMTKEKNEENNYTGISKDYYSDELRFVLEKAQNDELKGNKYIGRDLEKYILALNPESIDEEEKNRIDLLHPENKDKFFNMLNKLLSVDCAPLGKWPSRYMPSFMQQVSINLAVNKCTDQPFKSNGNIFSVNGPPGTGKTSLLKEIIVNNVVERAILLSSYNNPKDAFEAHDFHCGGQAGAKYDQYVSHWYSLKDDKINNYSILVVANNNGAAENITKELPKSIYRDVMPHDSDSPQQKKALKEIADLFNPDETGKLECINKKNKQPDEETHEEYLDIYFTKYARKLLNNEDVWGLVGAPLGKKSNISAFYTNVLFPLRNDFLAKRKPEGRISEYHEARSQFQEQLKYVRKLQADLKKIETLLEKKQAAKKAFNTSQSKKDKEIPVCEELINTAQNALDGKRVDLDETEAKISDVQKNLEKIRDSKEGTEASIAALKSEEENVKEEQEKERNSVTWFVKIFRRKKYAKILNQLEKLDKRAASVQTQINGLTGLLPDFELQKQQQESESESLEHKRNEISVEIQNQKNIISKQNKKMGKINNEYGTAKKDYSNACQAYDKELKRISAVYNEVPVSFDKNYVDRLLSDDPDVSTEAQVSDPWFTQFYNREREKLFAYAMRLHKEFIVSTQTCLSSNYRTLGLYWKAEAAVNVDTGKKNYVTFTKKDREEMMPALMQTLFLLVPVISTTFASVGSMLRDVQKPGTIGTLIVDEAGQAQPQVAVGALYRSRRAIIVGDPRQVEPVVNDDLDLLQNAFTDPDLAPYKDKRLSVQKFADEINRFGTYLKAACGEEEEKEPEWVGCPLLVHRRCISPMYEISNTLSYNGVMKQQTLPPSDDVASHLIYNETQWIDVPGIHRGNRNYFVDNQGQAVCEMLETAFTKNSKPDLYIISPFRTVVSSLYSYIRQYQGNHPESKIDFDYILDENDKKIGTVHTFQGREAEEVIFLLGCDRSEKCRRIIGWVNANIVNVAVTRARYRLYVVGDKEAWSYSVCMSKVRELIDKFTGGQKMDI